MKYLLCALLLAILLRAENGQSLTGKVVDTNGTPVSNATVFIYSGGPRVGTSSFCPTCYPDCRKKDTTDARGAFEIEGLDPTLLFRLLVVGKGYQPVFVPKIDPHKSPIEVRIAARKEEFPPSQSLRGRILDPTGKPVPNAVVNFEMFFGQESNCGGNCDGVDLVSVTDEQGHFLIGSEKKFDWMSIRVETPAFARKRFFQLAADKMHELKLNDGAIVTGRILKDGKPQKNVGVGLVSVDRSDNFTGNYDTFSNEEGRFTFFNVPPYQMYYVYSLMDSTRTENLIAPIRRVRVAADGSTRDIGDLLLGSGVRVKGRVILSDAKVVPPNTQLYVGREGAWDSRNVLLGGDGTFDLRGVPAESISLGVHVPGYSLSLKNKSLDRLNGTTLVGRVEADTYVEILLDPGQFQRPDFRNIPPGESIPRDKPLRGVEETNQAL